MKKFYTAALAALALASSAQAEKWVQVTNVDAFNYLDEVAIIYYNEGAFVNNGMPQKRAAQMIKNGTRGCVAMANQFVSRTEYAGQIWGQYASTNDVLDYEVNGYKITINNLPEGTALLNVKSTDDGFTIYSKDAWYYPAYAPNTQLACPGYITGADIDLNRSAIQTVASPRYNDITVGYTGHANITVKDRKTQDLFSLWPIGDITGNSQINYATFGFKEAKLDYGYNYFMARESDLPLQFHAPVFTPAWDFEMPTSKDGSLSFEINWEGCTGVLNPNAVITGNFSYPNPDHVDGDGTPQTFTVNINKENCTVSNTMPAKVTVTGIPVNTAGILSVSIPEGLFTLSQEGYADAPSGKTSFKCDVKEPKAKTPEYQFTPAKSSVVSEVSNISLEFTNCTATISEGVENGEIGYLAYLNGEEIFTPFLRNAFEYFYRSPIAEPGTYKLVFEPGFFTLSFPNGATSASPEITFSVTIANLNESLGEGWSVYPEPMHNYARVKSFVFDFDNAYDIEISTGVVANNFRIIHNGEVFTYQNGIYEQENEPWIMTLTEGLYAETSPGLVAVAADEGFWTCYDEDDEEFPSPALMFVVNLGNPDESWEDTFGPSVGVGRVDAVDGTFTVYNLQGVCLMRNMGPEAVTTLPRGLYIINGKKFMVR